MTSLIEENKPTGRDVLSVYGKLEEKEALNNHE